MSSLNLTTKQINQNVPKKLNLKDLRGTRERHGDYYLDGKFQFAATLPNVHGGSGSVTPGWLKVCRESVFLTSSEYADLVRCPMEAEDYEKLIREKIAARKAKDKTENKPSPQEQKPPEESSASS